MDVNTRVTQLEDEIKVLKNEVLAVLLDMKESLLNAENPFSKPAAREMPTINFTQSAPSTSPSHGDHFSGNGNNNGNNLSRNNGNGHIGHEAEEKTLKSVDNEPKPQHKEEQRPALEEPHVTPRETKEPNNTLHDIPSPNGFITEDTFRSWPSSMKVQGATQTAAPEAENGADLVSLDSLSSLIGWVQTTSMRMGVERTQTILDISDMMGQIPSKLKIVLENFIPAPTNCAVPDKIPAKIYLDSLKELARLLNKNNTSDFVVLHIVSHGLSSITRTG
ncbi:hypothetical protein DGWBC_1610 [Dehalogenimonas sp. WBC-2]|nr:hypothetical protein DGWBC_1610 [Dehalogenimonas sp. WBC-2]